MYMWGLLYEEFDTTINFNSIKETPDAFVTVDGGIFR
jgi:hypothetical protein